MAVPMMARGRLRGVIFAESETSFAFDHDDEQALAVVAGQLASALMLAELAPEEPPAHDPASCPERADSGRRFRFRYFAHDDSVFIDDDYVIKGVAGRLLYHFVRCHADSGRCDFANREIRRETALKLPDLKDNLETRLILLRQRLEDKQGPVRLVRPERGQLRLLVDGRPEIEVVEGA
jgi:GNAT superfamily N-acetyltransferase